MAAHFRSYSGVVDAVEWNARPTKGPYRNSGRRRTDLHLRSQFHEAAAFSVYPGNTYSGIAHRETMAWFEGARARGGE